MRKDVPDFLLEMSKQMSEQSNRVTSDPICQIRHKKWITCDPESSDHWTLIYGADNLEVFDSENGDETELFRCLRENEPLWVYDWEKESEGCLEVTFDPYSDSRLLPYRYGSFRKVHLKEADTPEYIDIIDVNLQIKELRQWVMSLTDKED